MNIFVSITLIVLMSYVKSQNLPSFHIIAPQNLCKPEKEDNKSTSTGVTVSFQPRDGLKLTYKVKIFFKMLGPSKISQRETLLIWKAVRTLEQRINILDRLQISRNNMVFINQSEVVSGVSYIFHIIGIADGGEFTREVIFNLKYLDGVLQNEHIPEGINLLLIASDVTISNLAYPIYAKVSFCDVIRNYYIKWNIYNLNEENQVLKKTIGTKINFPPNSFISNHTTNNLQNPLIEATVMDSNSSKPLATDSLEVTITPRGFQGYITPTFAIIGVNQSLSMQLCLINFDDSSKNLMITWEYISSTALQPVQIQSSEDKIEISFPNLGRFKITADILQNNISTKVFSEVEVISSLHITFNFLQMPITYHSSNEPFQFKVLVIGLFTNCTAGWISVQEDGFEYIKEEDISKESFGHVLVTNLAEKYLTEIADIDNVKVTKEIILSIPLPNANLKRWTGLLGDVKYKFRLDASCPFRNDKSYSTLHSLASKFEFVLNTNAPPIVGNIEVTPSSGFALTTVFKVSTSSAKDLLFHTPLSYELFGIFDNRTLSFGKYLEYKTWEIILPYTELPIELNISVCDNQNACNKTNHFGIDVKYIEINLKELNLLKSDITNSFSRTNFNEGYNAMFMALITFMNSKSSYLEDFKKFAINLLEREIDKLVEIDNDNVYISDDDIINFIVNTNEILEMMQVKNINILKNLLEILESANVESLYSLGTDSTQLEMRTMFETNQHKWNVNPSSSVYIKYMHLKIFLIEEIYKIDGKTNPENGINYLQSINSLIESMCYNNIIINENIDTPLSVIKIEKLRGGHLRNKEFILVNKFMNDKGYFRILKGNISDSELYCLVIAQYSYDYFTNDNNTLTQIQIYDLNGKNTFESTKTGGIGNEIVSMAYIQFPKRYVSESMCSIRNNNNWSQQFCKVESSNVKYLFCICRHIGYFKHLAEKLSESEESYTSPHTNNPVNENVEDVETVTFLPSGSSFIGQVSTLKGLFVENDLTTNSPKVIQLLDTKDANSICCNQGIKKGSFLEVTLSAIFLILAAILCLCFIIFYRRNNFKRKLNSNQALINNIAYRQQPNGIKYATICDAYNLQGNY